MLELIRMQLWNSFRQARCAQAERLTVMQHHVHTALFFHNNPSVCVSRKRSLHWASANQLRAAAQTTASTRVKRALTHTSLYTHTLSMSHRDRRRSIRHSVCVCLYVCTVRWTSARLLELHTCVLTAERHTVLPVSLHHCHCTELLSLYSLSYANIIIKYLFTQQHVLCETKGLVCARYKIVHMKLWAVKPLFFGHIERYKKSESLLWSLAILNWI